MHGSKDGDGVDTKTTLEEIVGQENKNGSFELFQNGEIHGLRNRHKGSLNMVAVNEATLQDNYHNSKENDIEDETIGLKLNNKNIQTGSCIFRGSKNEAKITEEDHRRLLSISDVYFSKSNFKKYEKLKTDLPHENHEVENEEHHVHDEFSFGGMLHVCAAQKRLLRVEQMPDHLQFNTYVHTGYRDLQSAWDCLLSMFYLHNETVNVLTHLIPIFGVLYYWRSMFPWDDIQGYKYFTFLGWSHIVGSITPWLGSVTYHLFMNHHRGPRFYKFLLQLDMLGIWITQAFGALTNLTASTWCLSDTSQQIWMWIYGIASAWGLYKAVTAESALGRRMCFALCFVSRILGFMLRISTFGGGDPNILIHVILQDIISIAGGFIGVIRIPELWFPGRLDMFFNSHHIMHVMVVLAVYHMNWATNGDVRWMLENYSKSQCVTLI